ncbi:protease modulator HflC [Candidatus Woesearchaeota archaeon]|nr:protease modulator HflC [Candidatus Woesearchaeota archaeon]
MNEEQNKPKRKLRRSIIKTALLTLGLITGLSSVYTVDQSQQAVITQFGRPVKVVLNANDGDNLNDLKESYRKENITVDEGPGLKFKIPFIQDVKKYEKRLLRWNGFPEEIPTKDKKYIWVDSTARWYIRDPLQFLRTVGSYEQAQARLDDTIDSATRNAITRRDLLELVRNDNREMNVSEEELRSTINVGSIQEGRQEIINEITRVSKESCEKHGIRIHPEGIVFKGLVYVDSVKQKVEDRMIAERERIAARYISEGNGEYEKILGTKDKEMKQIQSEAYKQARTIEGEADAEAARIYAEGFGSDLEFYEFVRKLQLYENSLEGAKLIIGTDNPLLEFIKGKTSNDGQ